MDRAIDLLRVVTATALMVGVAFLFAPANTRVEPFEAPGKDSLALVSGDSRMSADSLAEDIILYNLFSPSRSAPNRRASGSAAPDEAGMTSETGDVSSGFSPELIGTAVSDKPGETKALLRLLANDPAPRLYAVGDRAGGYSVVSIDPRSVVLNGPRGRVVLRLPQDEENHP
jgi:hypothetical protein